MIVCSILAGMLKLSLQTPSPPGGEREVNVMNTTAVVIEGRVQPDGRLEVTQKVKLPRGPVQVTIGPVAEPVQPDRFWKMMESIWADHRAGGRVPRTQEEIDAEIEPCSTRRKRKCRLSNVSRKSVARPGSKHRGRGSSLIDGLSGRLTR